MSSQTHLPTERLLDLARNPDRVTPARLWKAMSMPARRAAVEAALTSDRAAVVGLLLRHELARRFNFRPETVRGWPVERVVPKAALLTPRSRGVLDGLLHALHIGQRAELMEAYLDGVGVAHEDGEVSDLPDHPPEGMAEAASALLDRFEPEDVLVYLLTLRLMTPILVEGLEPWLLRTADALTAAEPDEPDETDEPGEDADDVDALLDRADEFTTLDRHLIRTLVNAAQGIQGALNADEVNDLIDELLHLNSDRHTTFFHLGFADVVLDRGLRDELPAENESRRLWYLSGVVAGNARLGRWAAIRELYDSEPDVKKLGLGGQGPSYAAGYLVFRALAKDDRMGEAAGFIDAAAVLNAPQRFVRPLLDEAARLLREQRPGEARAFLDILGQAIDELEEIGVDTEQGMFLEAQRRRAHCFRQLGQGEKAGQLLRGLIETETDAAVLAMLDTDLGLVEGGFRTLADVRLPRAEEHRGDLVAALEFGIDHFRRGAERHPRFGSHAHYCLGVLALAEKEWERAVEHLELALAGFEADVPRYSYGQLLATARLYLGMAKVLTLSNVEMSNAVGLIRKGLGGDARIPDYMLVDLLDAAYLADPECCDTLVDALVAIGGDEVLEVLLATTAGRKCPSAATALLDRALGGEVGGHERAAHLRAVLPALIGQRRGDEAAQCLDALEDLALSGVGRSEFAASLDDPGNVDGAWSPEDVLWSRVQCLAAEGDSDGVLRLLELAFHETLTRWDFGAVEDAEGMLARIRELGLPKDRWAHLEERLNAVCAEHEARDAAPADADPLPIRVLFVGGDERQEKVQESVRDAVREIDPAIEVEFEHPGWTGHWGVKLDRLDERLFRYGAVAIMTFVRTEYARRLRQRLRVPWRTCGGAGIRQMRDSILLAAEMGRRGMERGEVPKLV